MADRLRIRHGLNRMTDNEMIYDGIRTLINVRVGKGEGACMQCEYSRFPNVSVRTYLYYCSQVLRHSFIMYILVLCRNVYVYSRVSGCRCSRLYHLSAGPPVQLLACGRQHPTPSRARFRNTIQSNVAGDA